MQRLPAFRTKVPYASHRSVGNPSHLTIRRLGTRHSRTSHNGPGGFKFLLVAIDNFTKWIKAKPVTNVKADIAFKFLSNVIHRFRVQHSIITNNDSNFFAAVFKEINSVAAGGSPLTMHQYRIRSPTDRWNGPTDSLCKALSLVTTLLKQAADKWVDELPPVL